MKTYTCVNTGWLTASSEMLPGQREQRLLVRRHKDTKKGALSQISAKRGKGGGKEGVPLSKRR